ncbi:MAG: hypothetical protein K6C97_02530 [Treponema sp.]|nr:hypothetical protein [Treponema sp.]
MNKKSLILIILIFISFNAYTLNFNADEESLIYKVLDQRLGLRHFDTVDECISKAFEIEASAYKDPIYNEASEEFKLTIENLLKTARYNCIYEKDMKSPELKTLMLQQYEKILAYNKDNPMENRNPWYNVTSADIINSTMQFLPQSQAIKLGLEEKEMYDSMMMKYPDFSYLFINSGLWYMFAPAIGGGSDTKAMEYFQHALDTTKSDYEEYYAAIYYSQLLFDKKKNAKSQELLNRADKLLPGKRYIKLINLLNDNGYSVFYYTNNREKVDKKLGL